MDDLAGMLRELQCPLPLMGCLTVWLFCGMVALPYVHMAAKYLLPGVPAAAGISARPRIACGGLRADGGARLAQCERTDRHRSMGSF